MRRYEWEQTAGNKVWALRKVPDYFEREVPELRTRILPSFEPSGESKYKNMFVPKNILVQLSGKHEVDLPYVNKVGEVVNHWELKGISPKKTNWYSNVTRG